MLSLQLSTRLGWEKQLLVVNMTIRKKKGRTIEDFIASTKVLDNLLKKRKHIYCRKSQIFLGIPDP